MDVVTTKPSLWRRVREPGDVSLEQLEAATKHLLKALVHYKDYSSLMACGETAEALRQLGWDNPYDGPEDEDEAAGPVMSPAEIRGRRLRSCLKAGCTHLHWTCRPCKKRWHAHLLINLNECPDCGKRCEEGR